MTKTRTLFDTLTTAVNRHDTAAAAAAYGPDVVVASPDGTFTGRDAAVAYLARLLDTFPDSEVTVWSKVTSGDLVADEWIFTGTNTGPLRLPDGTAVAPTGRPVRLRGCDVAAVEDGHVISHRIYFDQADLLGQLGVAS